MPAKNRIETIIGIYPKKNESQKNIFNKIKINPANILEIKIKRPDKKINLNGSLVWVISPKNM